MKAGIFVRLSHCYVPSASNQSRLITVGAQKFFVLKGWVKKEKEKKKVGEDACL